MVSQSTPYCYFSERPAVTVCPLKRRRCGHSHFSLLRLRSWQRLFVVVSIMMTMMMMMMLTTISKATRAGRPAVGRSTTRTCAFMAAFATKDFRVNNLPRSEPQHHHHQQRRPWRYTRRRKENLFSSPTTRRAVVEASTRPITFRSTRTRTRTRSNAITGPIRTYSYSTADDSQSPSATSLNEMDSNQAQEQKQARYQELQWLSQEIRRLDDIYYNDNMSKGNSNSSLPDADLLSDDEYDALCRREAEICQRYPDLMEQWERESGLGKQATRYGGRVGIAIRAEQGKQKDEIQDIDENNPAISASTTTTTTTTTTTAIGRMKRQHHKPMLSLDNVHDTKQLLAWLERIRKKVQANQLATKGGNSTSTSPSIQIKILTEPKLDGLSLNLCYVKQDNNKKKDSFQLAWAATRGDGKQGQDVTSAVRQLVPRQVQIPRTIALFENSTVMEVRGEVIFPSSLFQQHVKEQKQSQLESSDRDDNATKSSFTVFSNARNAASGIVLRKESLSNDQEKDEDDEWRSKLCFYAYDLYIPDEYENELPLDLEQIRTQLQDMGFVVPQPVAISTLRFPPNDDDSSSNNMQESDIPGEMLHYYHALQKHRENPDTSSFDSSDDFEWGDYEMDGCVHKLVNGSLQKLMGHSNRAPRWAVAHKFPATAVVTELLQIQVQVGRTGALTPLAILEPIELGGVLVQRATLHNFGHMRHILGQGKSSIPKGSRVLVRRAGEVIPQVVSIVGDNSVPSALNKGDDDSMISLDEPTSCPACGSSVVMDDTVGKKSNRTSLGRVLRCGGPPLLCLPRAVSALRHAYSRDALDVTGLSEARIQQLMDAGLLRLPSDIFELARDPDKVESIAKMDGWGKKSATNLQAIANKVATEGVSLSRFIFSLGIRFVGVNSSTLIARIYGTVDAFLSDIQGAGTVSSDEPERSFVVLRDKNELTKGIGPSVLGSLTAFAKERELVKAAKLLAENIQVHPDTSLSNSSIEAASNQLPFQGLSIVFTGSLGHEIKRSDAQKIARSMGAKSTPSSLSKSTDILVTGEKAGDKKLEEAKKLGVRLLNASEFFDIVESFQENGL